MCKRSKRLSELLNVLADAEQLVMVSGDSERMVTAIAHDSRMVSDGAMFVCIRGEKHDGHDFIRDSVQRGAVAIVADKEYIPLNDGIGVGTTIVYVHDTRRALALLSTAFYDYPAHQLQLIGVTGTNGKTTTVHLIAACMHQLGKRVALLGTMGVGAWQSPMEKLPHTTPEAPIVQEHLRKFADAGVETVVMEVSSHALSQDRVLGCAFDVAVFTNLSQDHLDYHGDLDSYFTAKARLFIEYAVYARDEANKHCVGVVNGDDSYGKRLMKLAKLPIITYGLHSDCHVCVQHMDISDRGTLLEVKIRAPIIGCTAQLNLTTTLLGRFNVYNILAAIATVVALGEDVVATADAISNFTPPPGRLERVDEGQAFTVLVDYAHTPDGLAQVLDTLRQIMPARGRLIVVFGCGGDRDPTKRPKMGNLAATKADVVVITSDNPRSEDPRKIIDDILAGMDEDARAIVLVEPDRYRAIFKAIGMATANDLVLIAGKGHETYQIFRNETIPFDDRQVAREALRAMRNAPGSKLHTAVADVR